MRAVAELRHVSTSARDDLLPKPKTLLKTFRGVIVDIAGAVEDARRENANAILDGGARWRRPPRRDVGQPTRARRRDDAAEAAAISRL